MILNAAQSCLVIVDVQERLLPVMAEPRLVLRHCSTLMRAAARLGIPILVTEQYVKGIGPTMVDLRELAPPEAYMEKMHFSCAEDPKILAALRATGRSQVVLAGIEAHVCVLQSALRLAELDFQVAVATDACSSRLPENAEMAWQRMRANGIETVVTEMVLFEWLHCAGTEEFRDLLRLIK